MNRQSSNNLFSRLISAGLIFFITGLLLLGIETALSLWVYSEKGRVDAAFCEKDLGYAADCLNPRPLFHLRVAGLALYNAVIRKPAYKARRFSELSEKETASLDQWKGRGSHTVPLPWDKRKSAEYIYDALGRRVSRGPSVKKPKFLAFFGGSWVHGDWLPQEQTLPSQIESRMPAFKAYNYGIQGGGLQEFFLGSHDPNFAQGIPQAAGLFIYVHNWMHMDRLRPSVAYIAGRFNSPMADYIDDKELGYGGTFYEAFPVLTPVTAFAHLSGIGRLTGISKKMIPAWDVEKLYCDMLVQTKDQLARLNKNAGFVVLIYGQQYPGKSGRFPIRCLEENNIPYLAPFFDGKTVETRLPDGHPDSETHRKVAVQFSQWAKQFLPP